MYRNDKHYVACRVTTTDSITCYILNQSVVFQLQLLTTWGDPYYVGLNGLEVYSEDGYQLVLTNNRILYHIPL